MPRAPPNRPMVWPRATKSRARIAELEGQTAEIAALRDERETVRARVSGLLTQLEDLHLG